MGGAEGTKLDVDFVEMERVSFSSVMLFYFLLLINKIVVISLFLNHNLFCM